jgi:hypothetical protein
MYHRTLEPVTPVDLVFDGGIIATSVELADLQGEPLRRAQVASGPTQA